MGEVNQVVDHVKLEYTGVFNMSEMFAMYSKWMKEQPYEKGGDYVSEQNTSRGKFVEMYYYPWKKDNDYIRHFFKIRILIYDAKKVDVMVQGKKQRLDHGRVLLTMDGFIEHDYESRWNKMPMFVLFRTLAAKFVFKNYTKVFERNMIDDVHNLYERFERFFNFYRTYVPVKETAHFYH